MLVDPPAQAASLLPQVSALVEQIAIAQPKFAPLPPPEPQQDRRTSREPQPLPVTRAFVAARPIQESRPNLPLAIRATVISEVEVQIKVLVDESGRLVRIEPLGTTGPASDSLVSVTKEAARQWRFAPAMRGNRPVESEVVLTFRYIPKISGN
ncbi:MAG TPA: energy transducer TonB [Bryobacteraceae bacterium]|nr:energy transducer TonB [Bryobacteraceae bacterium]